MHKIANALLETVKPMLQKMADDTNDEISERELDATMKIVELAHYLLEIDMMKHKMKTPDWQMAYSDDDEMKSGAMANPKKYEPRV